MCQRREKKACTAGPPGCYVSDNILLISEYFFPASHEYLGTQSFMQPSREMNSKRQKVKKNRINVSCEQLASSRGYLKEAEFSLKEP